MIQARMVQERSKFNEKRNEIMENISVRTNHAKMLSDVIQEKQIEIEEKINYLEFLVVLMFATLIVSSVIIGSYLC